MLDETASVVCGKYLVVDRSMMRTAMFGVQMRYQGERHLSVLERRDSAKNPNVDRARVVRMGTRQFRSREQRFWCHEESSAGMGKRIPSVFICPMPQWGQRNGEAASASIGGCLFERGSDEGAS